jgi:hypothetical protein
MTITIAITLKQQRRINLMKKGILIFLLLTVTGCASRGFFPHSTGTQVDLSKNNYKIVKANAIGVSRGFNFLGIIPIVPPTYTRAMSDLYSKASITEGSAQALINVTQERSTLYLILFSIPELTVRADVIEFHDEGSIDE